MVTTKNQITSLILARGYEVKVLLFRLPREEEDVFPATIDSSHLDVHCAHGPPAPSLLQWIYIYGIALDIGGVESTSKFNLVVRFLRSYHLMQ